MDQETAQTVIVGLRALTEMRLKDAPARREARRVLREIQAASQVNLANFGVTATELPLCPNGPLEPKGNYWSTGCRDGPRPCVVARTGVGHPSCSAATCFCPTKPMRCRPLHCVMNTVTGSYRSIRSGSPGLCWPWMNLSFLRHVVCGVGTA